MHTDFVGIEGVGELFPAWVVWEQGILSGFTTKIQRARRTEGFAGMSTVLVQGAEAPCLRDGQADNLEQMFYIIPCGWRKFGFLGRFVKGLTGRRFKGGVGLFSAVVGMLFFMQERRRPCTPVGEEASPNPCNGMVSGGGDVLWRGGFSAGMGALQEAKWSVGVGVAVGWVKG
jgi:hypothetical protein